MRDMVVIQCAFVVLALCTCLSSLFEIPLSFDGETTGGVCLVGPMIFLKRHHSHSTEGHMLR